MKYSKFDWFSSVFYKSCFSKLPLASITTILSDQNGGAKRSPCSRLLIYSLLV